MRNKKLIALLSVVGAIVVLVIVSCAVFLVRNIDAYTYFIMSDELEAEYKNKVIAASGINYYDHMFFIDEAGVKRNIENAYFDVEVINIERKFPDGVSINFVIHDNLFQIEKGNSFYQCYSSGRIGSVTTAALGGFFTVKLSGNVSTKPGQFFQNPDSAEYKTLMSFINYLRSTGINDKQIAERIDFIELRKQNNVMIHTRAGSYIELEDVRDSFIPMLDKAWSAFVAAPQLSGSAYTSPSRGVFHVIPRASDGTFVTSYIDCDGELRYYEKYLSSIES
ncbi:MAG: FtsQ-type POTRA domain-containing protein [Clostridiales bacterium]|nr:FtsQ-type POTRA domain-containing protein [Clostridiales bacterium]